MGNTIIINGPNGTREMDEDGPNFILEPGEQVVGSKKNRSAMNVLGILERLAEERGIGFGDLIKKTADKMRSMGLPIPEHCTKCNEKQYVLNHFFRLGPIEAVKLLKEIL